MLGDGDGTAVASGPPFSLHQGHHNLGPPTHLRVGVALRHASDCPATILPKPLPFRLYHPGDFHEELLSSGFLAMNLTGWGFLFYNFFTNPET
jgi:hypothetical protein